MDVPFCITKSKTRLTLCDPSKIIYIDELDPADSVNERLKVPLEERRQGIVRPEVERHGDGVVCVTLFIPEQPEVAEAAALEMARHMNLSDPQVISRRIMHPAEGSLFEIKGVLDMPIRTDLLPQSEDEELLSNEEIEAWVRPRNIHLVAATVGEDEHSVGIHEILDIKHGGIERYGFHCHFLGTSVSIKRLIEKVVELDADGVLISTIVTHSDVHKGHMQQLHRLAVERGLREELLLVSGGTQVSDQLARECGLDAGFGRGTRGQEVANFLVRKLRQRDSSR